MQSATDRSKRVSGLQLNPRLVYPITQLPILCGALKSDRCLDAEFEDTDTMRHNEIWKELKCNMKNVNIMLNRDIHMYR